MDRDARRLSSSPTVPMRVSEMSPTAAPITIADPSTSTTVLAVNQTSCRRAVVVVPEDVSFKVMLEAAVAVVLFREVSQIVQHWDFQHHTSGPCKPFLSRRHRV